MQLADAVAGLVLSSERHRMPLTSQAD